ncbi:MAG: type II toxin-antitoxin system VapC family toxin [Deltaproteobacteria bacterium]|nr:type II toxin-antitoxin system VapC family toxin [Deltaproteobacteria bacterium]
MILPDVNVLIYAFRSDSLHHSNYRDWLNDVVNANAAYGMSPQILAAVIRICTHPRIYAKPSHLNDTLKFCRILLEQPNCNIITPGPRHFTIFADLCLNANASGNLIQDAWYAALAIEYGCEFITTDRDFTRFTGLKSNPPFDLRSLSI